MTQKKFGAGMRGKFRAVFVLAMLLVFAGLVVSGVARADESSDTGSDASEAVKGKTYVIATDTTFAPFEYRDSNGDLVGIDMDLIRAIAEEEGFNVEIQSLGFNAALQAVQSGTADMAIAGASITDERKLLYDFSDPYFDSGVIMAVDENSDIDGYDDLEGKVVVAKTGAEGETFANSIADEYGFTVVSVDQTSTMVQMVASGQADAMFDDYPIIGYGIAQGNGMKTVTDKEQGSSYGALVATGKNQELLAAFNEGLQKLVDNGEYQQILDKYITTTDSDTIVTPESDAVPSVKGKTYVIATDTTFAPFEYRDAEGNLVGIDMDLIRAIARVEGFNVKIDSLGFNAALQAVQSGTADMAIAGASITDERKLLYDFSDPYFDSGVIMAVDENSDIDGYDDLEGKVVVAKTGAEGETFANSIADEYGFTVVSVDQTSTMVQMVASGQADAMFDDYPIIGYGIAQGNGMKTVGEKQAGSSYGALVAIGKNQDLLQAFDDGLAKLQESGEYQQIVDSYISTNSENSAIATPQTSSFLELVQQSWPALLVGIENTLLVTVVAFAGAMVLGIVFGLMKLTHSKILRGIAAVYVWLFRGTPVLIWAFFFYFAVPQLTGQAIKLDVFTAGALALALNAGSYVTEIVRGAITNVDAGQTEAARCLGCSKALTMRRIVLPQAAKIAMPSLINQLIIMVKDSSLLLAIGFGELLYQAQQIYAANFRVAETLFIVAIFYLVTISILTLLANHFSRRLQS
jgi:polar amino acid transport system substrate-binding protein